MLRKKTFYCIILLSFLINVSAKAYTFYECWISKEGWGNPAANFTTNDENVYLNVRDSAYVSFMDKRWYRPDGTREDDIGTNLLAHPVYESGLYVGHWSYMVIEGKEREPGQWRAEHWVQDVYHQWHRLCSVPLSITEAVANPTFSPVPGTYEAPLKVTLNCDTALATIHYTTDGSEPTDKSTIYSTPIDVLETMTIKAKAYKTGITPSDTITGIFRIYKFNPSIPLLLDE